MEKEYTLNFVNKGKPFTIPLWTVEKHESALANVANLNVSEREKEGEIRYYIIYETLKEIDSNVSLKDIKNLHPEDLMILYNAVYYAGKRDIFFHEKKQRKKKSTGRKK